MNGYFITVHECNSGNEVILNKIHIVSIKNGDDGIAEIEMSNGSKFRIAEEVEI